MNNIFKLSDINREELGDTLDIYCGYTEYLDNNMDFLSYFLDVCDDTIKHPTPENLDKFTQQLIKLIYQCYTHIINYIDKSENTSLDYIINSGESLLQLRFDELTGQIQQESSGSNCNSFTSFMKRYIPVCNELLNNDVDCNNIDTSPQLKALVQDIIINAYIFNEYSSSKPISLAKLTRECDILSPKENGTFSYVKSFSNAKIPSNLRKTDFWSKHPYAHMLDVYISENENTNEKMHTFTDCYHWFQMFLLQVQNNSPLLPTKQDNNYELADEIIQPNKLHYSSSHFLYTPEELSHTFEIYSKMYRKFIRSLEEDNINKILFDYLEQKTCSYITIHKINQLLFPDYERLKVIQETIAVNPTSNEEVIRLTIKLYNTYFHFFTKNIECMLTTCTSPLVHSRNYLFEYTNCYVNDIHSRVYELLPNNLDRPSSLYYHASMETVSDFEYNEDVNNAEKVSEYDNKIECNMNHLSTLNDKFAPMLQEFVYKLLYEYFSVPEETSSKLKNSDLSQILQEAIILLRTSDNNNDTLKLQILSEANNDKNNSYCFIYSKYLERIRQSTKDTSNHISLSFNAEKYDYIINKLRPKLLWEDMHTPKPDYPPSILAQIEKGANELSDKKKGNQYQY